MLVIHQYRPHRLHYFPPRLDLVRLAVLVVGAAIVKLLPALGLVTHHVFPRFLLVPGQVLTKLVIRLET